MPFQIADPQKNARKCAIGVSARGKLPRTTDIPIGRTAKTIYLLQAVSRPGPSNLGAFIRFVYEDRSESTVYEKMGMQLTSWWFPELHSDTAGVAWTGPNSKSAAVGTTWTAIANPSPEKSIRTIEYGAVEDGAMAALFALTLSDQPHPAPRSDVSFGGPDNWSAASCVYGLIEGLAGAEPIGPAFEMAKISPRWISAGLRKVSCTSVLPASNGYVSYRFEYASAERTISLWTTGSGKELTIHLLLPPDSKLVPQVTVNDNPHVCRISKVETSKYVDFEIGTHPSHTVVKW